MFGHNRYIWGEIGARKGILGHSEGIYGPMNMRRPHSTALLRSFLLLMSLLVSSGDGHTVKERFIGLDGTIHILVRGCQFSFGSIHCTMTERLINIAIRH